MRAPFRLCMPAGAVLAWLVAVPVLAQLTEHEKWASSLRKSDERAVQRLGERWYNLVKLQEWKDVTGKYTVNAKYLSHDDEFTSVTLIAVRRTEQGRQQREIKVSLEKLDTMSRARVQRIARLKPIIEQRLQEVAEAEEEEETSPEDTFGRGRTGDQDSIDSRAEATEAREFVGRDESRRADLPRGRPQPEERDGTRPRRPVRPPLEEPDQTAAVTAATPPGDRRVPDAMLPDYVVHLDYTPDEFPLERNTERGGWQEFFEPFGDESHLEFRLMPAQPTAGETTRLLVVVSSVYGRPKPKTFVRLGAPAMVASDVSRSPASGPPWAEMPLVGGRIQDRRSERMVPLGETPETPGAEQPGESYYLIGVRFPPGASVIDFKLEDEQLGTVSFRAMDVEAAPPGPRQRGDLESLR